MQDSGNASSAETLPAEAGSETARAPGVSAMGEESSGEVLDFREPEPKPPAGSDPALALSESTIPPPEPNQPPQAFPADAAESLAAEPSALPAEPVLPPETSTPPAAEETAAEPEATNPVVKPESAEPMAEGLSEAVEPAATSAAGEPAGILEAPRPENRQTQAAPAAEHEGAFPGAVSEGAGSGTRVPATQENGSHIVSIICPSTCTAPLYNRSNIKEEPHIEFAFRTT